MITVEPLRPGDLDASVAMHLAHLRMGLFPKLGRQFMRCYHESFADSPYGVALVAREQGEIVGVLLGTSSNSAHYAWVVRNRGFKLGICGVVALLTRPVLAAQFLVTRGARYARAIMRRLKPATRARSGSGAPLSVLSHVVTAPEARRRGVGRKLVRAFAQDVRGRGVRSALLITEEGGMGTPFFERIGAKLAAKRTGQDGVPVREYRLNLRDVPAYERVESDRTGRAYIRSHHGRPAGHAGISAEAHHSPG